MAVTTAPGRSREEDQKFQVKKNSVSNKNKIHGGEETGSHCCTRSHCEDSHQAPDSVGLIMVGSCYTVNGHVGRAQLKCQRHPGGEGLGG